MHSALQLDIANDPAAAAAALDRLGEYLADAGYGPEVTGRVMVVADEVVSNIVRCAFPGGGRHRFSLSVAPALADGLRLLLLVVEDAGIAFDPTAGPEPDLDLSVEEREVGGLGMMLVRSMSRSLCYARQDGLNRLQIELDAPLG